MIKERNHHAHARLGLGTFRPQGRQAIDSVGNGLEVGYRHIEFAPKWD